MGSKNIWRHAKSVFSSQRYHGVPSDRTEKISPEWSNQIEGQENIEGNTKAEAIMRESSSPQKPHWINGVLLCAKATTSLLLLNIFFIVVAAGLSNRNAGNSAFSGFQVMYKGSCLLSVKWRTQLWHAIEKDGRPYWWCANASLIQFFNVPLSSGEVNTQGWKEYGSVQHSHSASYPNLHTKVPRRTAQQVHPERSVLSICIYLLLAYSLLQRLHTKTVQPPWNKGRT